MSSFRKQISKQQVFGNSLTVTLYIMQVTCTTRIWGMSFKHSRQLGRFSSSISAAYSSDVFRLILHTHDRNVDGFISVYAVVYITVCPFIPLFCLFFYGVCLLSWYLQTFLIRVHFMLNFSYQIHVLQNAFELVAAFSDYIQVIPKPV